MCLFLTELDLTPPASHHFSPVVRHHHPGVLDRAAHTPVPGFRERNSAMARLIAEEKVGAGSR
jgi:hypothetical protein